MVVENVTLPGQPHVVRTCRQQGCPARVSPRRRKRKDTYSEWRAALAQGREATEAYIKLYRMPDHAPDCPYKDLPMSVHLWCRKQESQSAALAGELEDLANARRS